MVDRSRIQRSYHVRSGHGHQVIHPEALHLESNVMELSGALFSVLWWNGPVICTQRVILRRNNYDIWEKFYPKLHTRALECSRIFFCAPTRKQILGGTRLYYIQEATVPSLNSVNGLLRINPTESVKSWEVISKSKTRKINELIILLKVVHGQDLRCLMFNPLTDNKHRARTSI